MFGEKAARGRPVEDGGDGDVGDAEGEWLAGLRADWYAGAAEVYDGAAERTDAVSKSGAENCRLVT